MPKNKALKSAAKKLAAGAHAAVTLFVSVGSTALADEPYKGYSYDWWGDPVPSQNGYVVDKVVSGADIGCGQLTQPQDMFFAEDETLYIADTEYLEEDFDPTTHKGRIVVVDKKFNLLRIIKEVDFSEMGDWLDEKAEALADGEISEELYKQETNIYFNNPSGVYVDGANVYVADKDNSRVLLMNVRDDGVGVVKQVFTRPDATYYDESLTFNPQKVLIDAAKNVYVCIKTVTRGALVFSREGSFTGYYGANRVQKTGEVIINAIWRLVMSKEQIAKMRRNAAVEIANFDIDKDNFVYTVTETQKSGADILKKMNSAGTNIFINLGYSSYTFGDSLIKYYHGKTYSSRITDVDIGPNGEINLLDLETGRVFQYDDECQLMFIFGGKGSQKGTFSNSVTALETLGTNVYVLDAIKASITVFKRTEFGEIVYEAMSLFNQGRYEDSKGPWEEVLRRDANYEQAFYGLGNAYLNSNDYETAMDYFYKHARIAYSDAFKSWRMNFIRDNFTLMAVILLVLLVLIYVIATLRGKKKAKKLHAKNLELRKQQKWKEE